MGDLYDASKSVMLPRSRQFNNNRNKVRAKTQLDLDKISRPEKRNNREMKGSISFRDMRTSNSSNPWYERKVFSMHELNADEEEETKQSKNWRRIKSPKKRSKSNRIPKRNSKKKISPRNVLREMSPQFFKRKSVNGLKQENSLTEFTRTPSPLRSPNPTKPQSPLNPPSPPSIISTSPIMSKFHRKDKGLDTFYPSEMSENSDIYCSLGVENLVPETTPSSSPSLKELEEPQEIPDIFKRSESENSIKNFFKCKTWVEKRTDGYDRVTVFFVAESDLDGDDIVDFAKKGHQVVVYKPIQDSKMYVVQAVKKYRTSWSSDYDKVIKIIG